MVYYALAPKLHNEPERQRAVDRHRVIGRQPKLAQGLTEAAARLFDARVGIATLIDRKAMLIFARHGLALDEQPRDISFCGHAIARPGEVMCVPDATRDPRFAGNPLVRNEPRIRFYIGAPLVAPGGHALGALCAIDSEPRGPIDPKLVEALKALAACVTEDLLHGAGERLNA